MNHDVDPLGATAGLDLHFGKTQVLGVPHALSEEISNSRFSVGKMIPYALGEQIERGCRIHRWPT